MAVLFNHTNKDAKGRRMTICGIVNDKAKTISIGIATCSSEDQFCKKTGRQWALKRAGLKAPLLRVDLKSENTVKEFFTTVNALVGNKLEVAV